MSDPRPREIASRLRAWSHDERLGDGTLLQQAADLIDALAASPAPAPRTWQPIETAPKDGTKVLLWSFESPVVGSFYKGSPADKHWSTPIPPRWEDALGIAELKPTHWVALPDPPVQP